jgi:type IV secretion system pilin
MIWTILAPFKFMGLTLGATCTPTGSLFLGMPTWYTFLPGIASYAPGFNSTDKNPALVCSPSITNLSDIWLIVAAVIEMLLRIAALAAIAFVIVGAVKYVTSQGEPEKTSKARSTIISALVGLAIAVVAAALVTFVAGQFKAS